MKVIIVNEPQLPKFELLDNPIKRKKVRRLTDKQSRYLSNTKKGLKFNCITRQFG